MRNLKRTLSLALAAVMLMGMMVVGAGAASKDFTDASDIKNVEAVDVMVALGVLQGGDKGDFQPNSILTREQAAKIICYLLLGEESAEKLTTNSTVFNDVAADRWSAPFIGYCVNLGILAGDGNGNFFPEGKLTGAAFAKMLLVALGYDAKIENYVGSDWMINVASDTIEAGISPKGLVLSNELSRQDAAQMAFLTLTANTVKYENKGADINFGDGNSINFGASQAATITNSKSDDYRTYDADTDDRDTVQQFCEKYFPDLKKDTTTAKNTKDDFARPGYAWTYKKDVVSFVADTPVATYAGADFDDDVVDALNDDYSDLATAPVYYNGSVAAGVDLAKLQTSVNGYSIEVYANSDDEVTAIVVTEPYVVEVAAINTDDDDAVTSVDLTVYEAGYYITNSNYASLTVNVKDDADAYAMIKDYAEEDVFMAFLKPGWDVATDMDATFLAVDDVETLDGKVTSSSKDATYNGWIKIDGTKYEFANEYSQIEVKTGSEGTFYLYNDYVVHFDGSSENDTEYLYVVRSHDDTSGAWGETRNYAEVVYTDGTSEVIDTKEKYAAGVYSFEYDKDEEYYVLNDNVTSSTINIQKGKTYIDGTTTADSATVYVSVKLDTKKFDSASVYTGYKNVPSMTATTGYVVAESGKAADYVFIVDGATVASADDMIYIAGASVGGPVDDADLGEYYTYNAVVDGEIVEIMVAKTAGDKLDGLYDTYKVDDDNIYSSLTGASEGTDYHHTTGEFKKAANEVITVGNDGTMAYADDVAVYVVATDGTITAGSINRNYSDLAGIDYTLNSDGAVTVLYLVKNA